MKNFAVLRSPCHKFAVLVMAKGVETPHCHLEEVAKALRQQQVEGAIIFDLLTSNGSRGRRFFVTSFDGVNFPPNLRFERVEADAEVREAAATYMREHLSDFDLTLLTPAMQFAAKKGIPL